MSTAEALLPSIPTGLLPASWVDREYIRVGASLLAFLKNPSMGKVPLRRRAFARMAQFELSAERPDLLEADEQRYLSWLECLQPTTLGLLCSLPSADLGPTWVHHRKYWEKASLRLQHDGDISPIAGAKLIANRIMAGNLTAPQLIHIAHDELGANWTEVSGLHGPLNTLISSLSTRRMPTESRLQALADFRQAVGGHLPRWTLVENTILHQIFTWPLLVLKAPGCPPLEFTLPVAIDVYLDGKDRETFRSNGIIDCSNWKEPVARALAAAKDLWMNKHLAWPRHFCDLIESAKVVVDVTAAEEIVGSFGVSFGLTGDSAELYLSLVILANFLDDRAAIETMCATGVRATRRKDDEGGADWRFKEPADIDLKLECAKNAFLFDTLLVATSAKSIPSRGHLKICTGIKLSDFATHVFGQRHRKNQFIRAADLADAYRSEVKEEREEQRYELNDEVKYVLEQLEENDSNPVYEFPRDIKAESIAKALRRVNDRAAEAFPSASKKNVGSFAFVRVVKDESNERFWQVIWDLIKGSPQTFFDFRFRASRTEPGKLLAWELNKWPTADTPARAPDVLVIVGAEHLHQSFSDVPHGPFSRLQLQQLLPVLRKSLVPTHIKGVARQIGATRIILVADDHLPSPRRLSQSQRNLACDPDLMHAIQTLSVFRHGFTFQMARQILKVDEEACERLLRRLQDKKEGHEGKSFLRFGGGAGEYYFQLLPERIEELSEAESHFAAANSIVGFLAPTDLARFDFQEALTPARLHEAQWHLKQAKNHGHKKASGAHERLSRLGEVFGWTRIRYAAYSQEDGEELLEAVNEHISKVRKLGWAKYRHPVEFVYAAKFAFQLARRRRTSHAHFNELRRTWQQYFNWAETACGDLAPDERDACKYIIATSRACMVMAEARNGDGLREAWADMRLASQLQQYEGELLDFEWFEFMGDREHDDARAAQAYEAGIVNKRIPRLRKPRLPLVIKYLGALRSAGLTPPQPVLLKLRQLARPGFIHYENRDKKSGLCELGYIQERWRTGRACFLAADYDQDSNLPSNR